MEQIQDEDQWITSVPEDPNAVYVDFKPENALEKLKRIQQLSYEERKIYTQHLNQLVPLIGQDIVPHIGVLLQQLSEDSDQIIMDTLKQITEIMTFLKTLEKGYEKIVEITTNTIFSLLSNPKLDIKEEVGKKLSSIADLLTEEDRGTYLLKKVLEMAHDDKNEENRIVAVQLLSKLAHSFGAELCDNFVTFEFLSLGDDPKIRVRRETVINLPVISKVCSAEVFQKRLLPFFQSKCEESLWGLRKACVDIIVELSEISIVEDKEKILTPIMLKFLEDSNKWVKIQTYKNLGPFIATLENGNLNDKLFMYFLKMTEHSINYMSNNNDVIISCSYYFPAVLQVYGKDKWPQLKNTLNILIKHKNKQVRKPVACALHDIAHIIGEKKSEKDLFDIYENILVDPSEEVKYGAIQHLAKFLSVFDAGRREDYLEIIQNVQKDHKKWRVRELVSKQIGKLCKIYTPDVLGQYIMPISLKLCNDQVSIVREKASRKMHKVILALIDHEIYSMSIVMTIQAYNSSDKYTQRQVFVVICSKLLKHPDLFIKHFMDTYEQCAKDKVSNVRITLTKELVKYIADKGPMAEHERIRGMINVLKEDPCQEIQRQLSYLNSEPFSLVSAQIAQQFEQPKEKETPKQQEISQETTADESIQQAREIIQEQQELKKEDVKQEETSTQEEEQQTKQEEIKQEEQIQIQTEQQVKEDNQQQQSSEKQEEQSPVKQEEQSPVKQEEQSPVKQEEQSPEKQEKQSPEKQEKQSPEKQEEQSPEKQEETVSEKQEETISEKQEEAVSEQQQEEIQKQEQESSQQQEQESPQKKQEQYSPEKSEEKENNDIQSPQKEDETKNQDGESSEKQEENTQQQDQESKQEEFSELEVDSFKQQSEEVSKQEDLTQKQNTEEEQQQTQEQQQQEEEEVQQEQIQKEGSNEELQENSQTEQEVQEEQQTNQNGEKPAQNEISEQQQQDIINKAQEINGASEQKQATQEEDEQEELL